MLNITIEYVEPESLWKTGQSSVAIPVVRLAEVEKLIQEAEWAMGIIKAIFVVDGDECQLRAQAFLASVAARRKGQL